MSERFLVIEDRKKRLGKVFKPLGAVVVRSSNQVMAAYRRASRATWFASDVAPLERLFGSPRGHQDLLLYDWTVEAELPEFLYNMFRHVLVQGKNFYLLPPEEIANVLLSQHRKDLFIGGTVDTRHSKLVLYRGDFEPLVVPLLWFEPGLASPQPDFSDIRIADNGLTVCFGEYEAAGDAILYEFDTDFRRREKKRRIEIDDSFGGALRRLRLQRSLRRTDFEPISAREIARIERGEVKKPRKETLKILARHLGVRPKEIESY